MYVVCKCVVSFVFYIDVCVCVSNERERRKGGGRDWKSEGAGVLFFFHFCSDSSQEQAVEAQRIP
jgi:hypothetical protein